ncbi:PAS domain-containing sensor histidine kinase [Mucilaginibacter gotjawali]|uniref:PAS domain S-box-containing protein n=2 Tax=Mucilaginibacter gotjawali TaxID=1550579 RepID=A0A839SFP7_9SPHI|nr:PAS domain-containing sensor histidine kinase [Mucilaginibacter gotjawali]MBB3056378.1 PAS domain S-box-containing protein [Mucilaginibacter gotjawali]BAU55085.1 Cell-division control histidine kinase PdhS [Mucilaginibacter gotjawali]
MENNDLLKAVIENVVDGIIIIDDHGTILTANPSACILFGYDQGELNGKNIGILMTEHDRPEHQSHIDEYKKTGQARIIGKGREVKALKKDGSVFPARLAVSEVKYLDKILFAGVVHDLSLEKKAEEERHLYTSKLEAIVEERTGSLKNIVIALEKAKDEVYNSLLREKEVNQLKTQFVSVASHEFRTPLSSIQLSASLIEQYYDKLNRDKVLYHLSKIKSSVNYITAILNDFLSVERIESGKLKTELKEIDLKVLMHEIIMQLSLQARPGQRIDYMNNGGPERIMVDDNLLRHSVFNLLSNAIKYSGEDGVIEVKTIKNEEQYIITVRDNGIGIPVVDQAHLFEPFFRAGNIGTIQGTGLGLNIVKRYVELMNGKISFKSDENGTIFELVLPVSPGGIIN